MSSDDEGTSFGLVMSFWIDTDTYSQRDKDMFCSGWQFHQIYHHIKSSTDEFRLDGLLRSENESRVRMMCSKLGRRCEIRPTGVEGWSNMVVFAACS